MILTKFFQKQDARSLIAYKNISSSFLIKGISIIINLALIPLTIDYLSPTKYGVWLTISSMLGWINFFDIGLGHGLRNKLAEALAKNETEKAKAYVSTAYFSISLLCCVVFILFLIINYFLNWNKLLNIPVEVDENLKTIALILFSMFSIQFVLQLINSIFLSNQKSARVSLNNMLSNLLVLIGIFVLTKYTHGSLFYIAFLFSTIPVTILAIVNIYYFKTKFKSFSPSIKNFDFSALKDVLNLGVKFFIIQISVMIFFETSNLLISRYFGPALVTPYNIAFRYFGIITMIFSMLIGPYWSACTEAYVKKEFEWIQKTVNKLYKMWFLLVLMSVVMLLFSNYAYYLWVGDKVKVDFKISLFMMLYVIITSFGNIHIMVLNGVGKLRIQMIFNIIGMLVFIPLSYYFAVMLNFGIVGIIAATIICSLYGTIVAPFEVKRLLLKANNNKF